MRTPLAFRGRLLLRHSLLRRARDRAQPRRCASVSERHAICQAAIHVNDRCNMPLWIPYDTANVPPTRATQKPRAGTLPPQNAVCTVRLIDTHPRPSRLQPTLHRREIRSLRGVTGRPGPGIIRALHFKENLRLRARASTAEPSNAQLQTLIPPRTQAISGVDDSESPRRDAASKPPAPSTGRAGRPSRAQTHARGSVGKHATQRGEDAGHAQRSITDALARAPRRPPSSIARALDRARRRPALRGADPDAKGVPPRADAPPPALAREQATQTTVEPLGDRHRGGGRGSF